MPRKTTHEIKASLIVSESASRGSLFHVIASAKPEKPKAIELSGYGCKSCGAEFAAIKGSEPFCVVCSADSDNVESLDDDIEIEEIDDAELASVCCNSCNTHLIISMEAAKVFDTKLTCVTCGTDVEYELDFEDEELGEDLGEEEEETFEEEEEIAEVTETDEIILDGDNEGNNSTGEEILLPTMEESSDKKSPHDKPDNNNNDADDVHKNPPVKEDQQSMGDSKVIPDKTKFDDADNENKETGAAEIEDVDESGDELVSEEIDLLENVDGDLTVARHGDVIIAYKGGIPVATLVEENAGDNKGVFRSSGFSKAIASVAKKEGVSALAGLGFESVKVSVPLKSVVESKVTAKVEVAKTQFEEKAKTLQEDMEQCLGLALAGMNKGFFRGTGNVLKTAFISELAAAGIRNPSKLVDKVFSGYSEEFSKTLLGKAFELSSKSLEVRNELAEAIGDSEFTAEEEIEDGDEEFSEEITVARLSRGGKPKAPSRKEEASISLASKSVSESIEQARALGGTTIFKR